MLSHTRHGVRFVTSIGFCVLRYHTRNSGGDLLRAWVCASCDIMHEAGGTICSGNWVSASCDITHEIGGTICSGHWVLRHLLSHTRQVRFVTGIGFCGRSASCDITHKSVGKSFYGNWVLRLVISHSAVCYGHWVLHLVISHARQGVRSATGGHRVLILVISHAEQAVPFSTRIGFCVK